jgi:hypothetical protein
MPVGLTWLYVGRLRLGKLFMVEVQAYALSGLPVGRPNPAVSRATC